VRESDQGGGSEVGGAGGGAEGWRSPEVEPEGAAVGEPETEPEPTPAPAAAAPEVEPWGELSGAGWRPPEGDGVYMGVLWRPGGVREGAPFFTAFAVQFADPSKGTHPERRRSCRRSRIVDLVCIQIVVLSSTYSVQTRILSLKFVCHISRLLRRRVLLKLQTCHRIQLYVAS
jgi:hypothetical protein